eukprot:11974598-Prorocentrum_lima.AAC.1
MTSSLVGSEMCIRDSKNTGAKTGAQLRAKVKQARPRQGQRPNKARAYACLLYTSDAADDM